MTDDLVQRLREVGRDGTWKSRRNPTTAHPMCIKAADRIESQAAEIEEWRSCARYDAMMEGPAFKGWDRSALERCRRAALQEQSK
jgi:hypothetical protein